MRIPEQVTVPGKTGKLSSPENRVLKKNFLSLRIISQKSPFLKFVL